ncbi:uracil-DNA glycosylase family protein, partial [Vibrio anguillarum]|uniref:uracil-DNA glycosylase family protein n=1 Tax=Vibrio anguillarum TaxID=55601 RepID=UPI001BE42167
MGLNPGGSGFISIGDHIDQMLTRTENSYLDEAWVNGISKYEVGQAPWQKRVSWLMEQLGYDVRDVCSTNLIFTTSKSSNELCFGLAGICWAFHESVLEIVQPKLIITFGNAETSASPYFFLKSLFKGNETTIASGHGQWVCKT